MRRLLGVALVERPERPLIACLWGLFVEIYKNSLQACLNSVFSQAIWTHTNRFPLLKLSKIDI